MPAISHEIQLCVVLVGVVDLEVMVADVSERHLAVSPHSADHGKQLLPS